MEEKTEARGKVLCSQAVSAPKQYSDASFKNISTKD
jgi:hypothetical protein